MTLADFLLARIAEDEELAREEISDGYGGDRTESGWSSARVLAECEARRGLVEAHQALWEAAKTDPDVERRNFLRAVRSGVEAGLLAAALPYADHPDYRQEWRP